MSESLRVDGKPRKKDVCSLGTAYSESEVEHFRRLGAKVIEAETAKRLGTEPLFDASRELEAATAPAKDNSSYRNLRDTHRTVDGPTEVFGALFDSTVFGSVLSQQYSDVLKNVVLARISAPTSKRKAQAFLEKNQLSEVSLNSVYRMMVRLSENIDIVNQCAILES